jgi:hypothetical protein
LDPTDGTLISSRLLNPQPSWWDNIDDTRETVWYAYVETNPPSEWFNGQTYVDTLSPAAIREFVNLTHEKYRNCPGVGNEFGTTVPCIFTDEPQFATKVRLSNPFAKEDVFLPWTNDLPKTFYDAYDTLEGGVFARHDAKEKLNLVACLPELFWNKPRDQLSLVRYRFHDHVCERFVSAFMDQLGAWCTSNNILLNGHMMEEPTLESQTHSLGEAMRCYRSQTLPGIDLLSDMVEYNTAKQASSVARQSGIKGCMSEIYGCTHWYFTFEGHKGCGDWQAALGITFRVPHLAWASMAGEAKRDYPASINYQSPWYQEYGYVENHFARVGVAMTRGQVVTRVAVIHPIESFWLVFGPAGVASANERYQTAKRDQAFKDLTDWLLHGLMDFDFISESLLPKQHGGVKDRTLVVGKCRYDAVIVPDLLTIRSSTLEVLTGFAKAGGKVIIAGSEPELVDGEPPSPCMLPLFNRKNTVTLPWDKDRILCELDEYRELAIWNNSTGFWTEKLLYQMRQDGKERFVFICNTDRTAAVETRLRLRGEWEVELLDTLSGKTTWIKTVSYTSETGSHFTLFPCRFDGCASVLLRLVPKDTADSGMTLKIPQWPISHPMTSPEPVYQKVGVTLKGVELTERGFKSFAKNVLMLDFARYKVDDDVEWSHMQEILEINNEILGRLNLPRKGAAWRQPWTLPPSERRPRATVSLMFQFLSDVDESEPMDLAVELPKGTVICLNDRTWCPMLPSRPSWFVDEAITTIHIPTKTTRKGLNTLILKFPFGILTPIERVYLLGKFMVVVYNGVPRERDLKVGIIPWPSAEEPLPIRWGDITKQGLPFYVGNVTYKCGFTLPVRSKATLSVPQFSSPVLAVEYGKNGDEKKGHIAFQPRRLDLGVLDAGTHTLSITAYGNRYNAFGHIHAPDSMTNCWPDAWRTQGWAWTDDYNVKPIGVLESPTVLFTDAQDASPVTPVTDPNSEWAYVRRSASARSSEEWLFIPRAEFWEQRRPPVREDWLDRPASPRTSMESMERPASEDWW